MSAKGNLARNGLINLTGHLLPLLIGVIALPRIIEEFGVERFGVLSFVWVMYSAIGIFDLGVGRAVTQRVAKGWAQGSIARAGAALRAAVWVQALLGLIGSAVVVLLAPALVSTVLKVPKSFRSEALDTFLLAALFLPTLLVSASYRGALEALQRFDLVNLVKIPLGLVTFAVPLVVARIGGDLRHVVLIMGVTRLCVLVVQWRLCGWILAQAGRITWSDFTNLLRFGGWVSVSGFVDPILGYLDRFILAAMASLSAVAYYTAPFEIVTRLLIVPGSLAAALYPSFSALRVRGETETIAGFVARSLKYVLLSLGPLAILLAVWSNLLLRVWLGISFAGESRLVLQVLAIGVVINGLAYIPYSLVQAVERPDLTAKFHLLELPVHVVLLLVLVKHWGPAGAAIAWTLRITLDAVLLYGASYALGLLRDAVSEIPRVMLLTTLLGLATLLIVILQHMASDTWQAMFLQVALLMSAIFTGWRYALTPPERIEVVRAFSIR